MTTHKNKIPNNKNYDPWTFAAIITVYNWDDK